MDFLFNVFALFGVMGAVYGTFFLILLGIKKCYKHLTS